MVWMKKRWLLALVCAAMLLLGGVAAEDAAITVDENGVASWEPVEGAVYYVYLVVDSSYTSEGEQTTEETSVQLPYGCSLHMQAVFADGSTSDWETSDYYGLSAEALETMNVNAPVLTVDENGVASWEPVEGAAYYVYKVVDGTYTSEGERTTEETSVQLPYGYCLHVQAVFDDGSTSAWGTSDFYGEPIGVQ